MTTTDGPPDPQRLTFPLVGPGGEPVDLRTTFGGHGITGLPPLRVDEVAHELHATIAIPGSRPRRVTIRQAEPGGGEILMHGSLPNGHDAAAIHAAVRRILRLDDDLSPFYALAAADPSLAWATRGAGRLTRCQSVFEEVVKTVCTTNCAWSATVRMVDALVGHLGEPAEDAPGTGSDGRVFPTPAAMAAADEAFYRERVRCGYRGAYLRALARSVVEGELDLEAMGRATAKELPDEELERRLLALPGVGPYAASHVMLMLGRYSRLVFDSWTRPTYARLTGDVGLPDTEIAARFARYGRFAGLAFWLTITREWHEVGEGGPENTRVSGLLDSNAG